MKVSQILIKSLFKRLVMRASSWWHRLSLSLNVKLNHKHVMWTLTSICPLTIHSILLTNPQYKHRHNHHPLLSKVGKDKSKDSKVKERHLKLTPITKVKNLLKQHKPDKLMLIIRQLAIHQPFISHHLSEKMIQKPHLEISLGISLKMLSF
jgi:hypothetical protein